MERHGRLLDQLAGAIIEGEKKRKRRDKEDGKKKDVAPEIHLKRQAERQKERDAQLERRQREYLYDEANYEIYTTWRFFGGREKGISIEEAASMDMNRRHDFMLIETWIHEDREWDEYISEQGQKQQKPPSSWQS